MCWECTDDDATPVAECNHCGELLCNNGVQLHLARYPKAEFTFFNKESK